MDTSQLTAFGYGVLVGLVLAIVVGISAWLRRRTLEQELRRLHSHLHDHIAKSNAEYREGKARDVSEFLAELKAARKKKQR